MSDDAFPRRNWMLLGGMLLLISLMAMTLICYADDQGPKRTLQGASASPDPPAASISNAYIRIDVDDDGQFVMGTTGGIPGIRGDEDKPLMYGFAPYGKSEIGTSYSTVRIVSDTTPCDFKLDETLPVTPTIITNTNTITTTWTISDVVIVQVLSLADNPYTGRADTARIQYTVTNSSTVTYEVGIRCMLDIMLGYNDGAPLFIPGIGEIVKEREYYAPKPPYWRAFADPDCSPKSLQGMGILTGYGATPHDRFVIARWKKIYDARWDYTVATTKRIDEDSAVAVYWDPVTLAPGDSHTFTTFYGLGSFNEQASVVWLPAIDATEGWETWVQVQNVGTRPTRAVLFLWGPYSQQCEPNAPGPIKVMCSGLIEPGAFWIWELRDLSDDKGNPLDPKSGVVYSVQTKDQNPDTIECPEDADEWHPDSTWRGWPDEWPAFAGEPIAVTVDRVQTDDPPTSSTYAGISAELRGTYNTIHKGYMYYAPLNFRNYNGWNTKLIIQNTGDACTSVEVWYQEQDRCLRWKIQDALALAPGESVRLDPLADLGDDFRGTAWIRASQPLGMVVDEYGNDKLLSYRGVPADFYNPATEETTTFGSLTNYVPLIYREHNGWDAGLQVQNLSATHSALVKASFLDHGGAVITTLVDWICPRGSQTFFLPAIANLPGQYVGSAKVESQNWWSPGDEPVDAPNILSVVNLINYYTGQGLSYNAFSATEAEGVTTVALPFLAKEKRDPFGPPGSTWTSEIAIHNLNPNPGQTGLRLDFYDPNGLLYSVCQTLGDNQVDYINLADWHQIPPGFLGSGVITATCSTQDGGPSIAVVVVERAQGYPGGDLTKGYAGFPVPGEAYNPQGVPPCPPCQ